MSINDTVALELMKMLKEIRNDRKHFKKQNSTNKRRPSEGPNTTSDNNRRKKKKCRTNIAKYCWSCGAWNHHSKDCRFKNDGHKDNATFDNKMNGRTYHCQEVNKE